MTQGQGEGKVKLHTINLVAADKHGICLSILLKIQWGIRNTFAFLDCSPLFLPGRKKIHAILVNSVVHVGQGRDSWKISGIEPSGH